MVYRMIFNQTAYFGRGAVKEIPAVAKQHGFTKAFIVTDPVLLEKSSRTTNSVPSVRLAISAASMKVPTGGASKMTYWNLADSAFTNLAKR